MGGGPYKTLLQCKVDYYGFSAILGLLACITEKNVSCQLLRLNALRIRQDYYGHNAADSAG